MFSKYGTAGPLPTHKRFWLDLFNPLLVPLQTHSLLTHLEFRAKRLLCSFPAFPGEQNEHLFISVDVTKRSAPIDAVWQGGLDGKSFVLAL